MSSVKWDIQRVDFKTVFQEIEGVIDLSTRAFLTHHEITRDAYARTQPRHKHMFTYLFKEHVADMAEEIERQGGLFFVARQEGKIVAISMGRTYGKPALSQTFMKSVFASACCFKEVMGDWWKLMQKFQLEGEVLSCPVYHQAMTAVDPDYAGKGLGTDLSAFIMKTVTELGFKVLVRETSSVPSHRVAEHLKERDIHVVDIDSVTNGATKVDLILRLQTTQFEKAQPVITWFQEKQKLEGPT